MHRKIASYQRFSSRSWLSVASLGILLASPLPSNAKDYFLVIGGGPNKEQNQASMEANVLFLNKVLATKASADRDVSIFFADGNNPDADLQVIAPSAPSNTPVLDLLRRLHRRGPAASSQTIEYRNHTVPEVQGSTHVRRLERAIRNIGSQVQTGDRVFLYVTAHGSAGPRSNPHNTRIACWGSSLPVSQLMDWLDDYPKDVPVISMMAQCYAGGFANIIFDDISERMTPTDHLRVGFYAQQYDLQAAGCRPDIERDEEFSSYFWGAIYGEMRNGTPIHNADLDGDERVSFEEAFVYTVCYGDTIDIPLRGSDLFLRAWSRIPDYTLARDRYRRNGPAAARDDDAKGSDQESDGDLDTESNSTIDMGDLQRFEGTFAKWMAETSRSHQRVIEELCRSLEIDLDERIENLADRLDSYRRSSRNFGPNRRGRFNSGRRELLEAIAQELPDLKDPDAWEQSEALNERDQMTWMADIEMLPEYATYQKRMEERKRADSIGEENELQSVKYRRLIETLETILLEKNLPRVAPAEVQERYASMRALESVDLIPPPITQVTP